MDGANDVVIAHELLHTLGATDKYDPATTRRASRTATAIRASRLFTPSDSPN